uniref:Uncharacterized protein n=1 Tax=Triticum urartu TaxID=4572 RepID=A0A8R7V5K8_TRIUA
SAEHGEELVHAPVAGAAWGNGLGRLLAHPCRACRNRLIAHHLLHLLPYLRPAHHRSLLRILLLPAPVLHPHPEAAASYHRRDYLVVAQRRPCQHRHAVRGRLRHRPPPGVAQEQPHGRVLQDRLLVHPLLGHQAAPLHAPQEPVAQHVPQLRRVLPIQYRRLHHPQEQAAARLQPGADLADLFLRGGVAVAEGDVDHRACWLLPEPGDRRARLIATSRGGWRRLERADGEHRRESGNDLAASQANECLWLQGIERVDEDAVCFGDLAAVDDELLGEEAVGVAQHPRAVIEREASNAGNVDVADEVVCVRAVKVDGEVGEECQHGCAGREEDVAWKLQLVLSYGDNLGSQGDVRDDGRRARCGGSDERAEEMGRAAQGLPPQEEGLGVRKGGGVERQEVEVDAPDGGEGGEEAGEVLGLGLRDRREGGHDGDVHAHGGDGGDEAGEREEVAHAGARDEDQMRCAAALVAGARHRRGRHSQAVGFVTERS